MLLLLLQTGSLTIEGGGLLQGHVLHITSDVVDVNSGGLLSVNGKGFITGPGAGNFFGGASYGGKGARGSSNKGTYFSISGLSTQNVFEACKYRKLTD